MNKKLLALVMAAAMAAPFAASADSNVIYGKMHYSWDFADTNEAGDSSDDAPGISRASRLGFKGSEDLGDGMKAVFQIESQINSTVGSRNTFVGLAGGFGTVVLGRHDTPYKIATGSLDIFGDTAADYNNIIGTNSGGTDFDERVSQTIAYITPTMGGFHGAIARVSLKANEDTDTTGTPPVAIAGNDETEAWSVAGIYKNGPLFGSLAWESHSGPIGLGSTGSQEEDALKLGLGYSFGDSKIGFIYENIDHDGSNSALSRDAYYINFAQKFGANTFKIAYGNADDSDAATNDGADTWAVGIDHAMSKRTKVYGLYTTMSNDSAGNYGLNGYSNVVAGKDVDAFSVGIVHKF